MAAALAVIQGLRKKVRGNEYYDCRTLQVDMPAPSAVDVEFKNLTLQVSLGLRGRTKKTILKDVSGLFKSGELTAIMGPSGAGKSSLMNALTGFGTSGVTGTIRAGDSVCELGSKNTTLRKLKAYRKKSCYILQDDRLNPLFTVQELMKFAADLKLGYTLTDKLKNTAICEVLETLGLTGTENTRCGNLSGGQKKRLSIAVELIDNPPIIFLDEPTTGLDSLTSGQCIEMLKKLAKDGRTVVCTIHQPSASIYAMFDQVYVLADGVCVYNGISENTVPFFASLGLRCPKYHNPADYMLEVTNREYGDYTETLAIANKRQDWRRNENIVEISAPNQKKIESISKDFSYGKTSVFISNPSELYKFSILLKRCLIQQYRDWTVTHLKVALHIFIGVAIGMLFGKSGVDGSKTVNNLGYLLICVVYLCYTSLMPAVLRFPQEMPVVKKEIFNNWYNLKTYYFAVLVTGIPIQIWYSFVYTVPSYFLTSQPAELPRFFMFLFVLSIVTVLADAIGNIIGTCVDPINGTFLGAILTCAMLVFAGFLALFPHMTSFMRSVSYMSFMKYAVENLVLSLYSFGRKPLECPDTHEYCHYLYPKVMMKEFYFQYDNYWWNICILVIQTLVLRVIAYFTLRQCMRRSV